jgi:long-chain acyl-CoA synthetase
MENTLRGRPGIGQAVVLGDGRPFVAALLTLDPDSSEAKRGKGDPSVTRMVDEAIAEVNRNLSHPEQIKKWAILDADFVVGDELTPTMKVKRKRIAEKYRTEIEQLYGDKRTASANP